MVRWFKLNYSQTCYNFGHAAGMDCIPTLIQCLASNCEALVLRALVELQRLVIFSYRTVRFITGQIHCNICTTRPLESLPPVNQRHIATLISSICVTTDGCNAEAYASLLPLLLFFVHSSDENLISSICWTFRKKR